MMMAKLAGAFLGLVVAVQGIGNCREDLVCEKAPDQPGSTCSCWSTCSFASGGRKCDGQNPAWSGYNRTNIGGNDVGCRYIPAVKNARDLCVWYYEGDVNADQIREEIQLD